MPNHRPRRVRQHQAGQMPVKLQIGRFSNYKKPKIKKNPEKSRKGNKEPYVQKNKSKNCIQNLFRN
jgi:hypothetical protein